MTDVKKPKFLIFSMLTTFVEAAADVSEDVSFYADSFDDPFSCSLWDFVA